MPRGRHRIGAPLGGACRAASGHWPSSKAGGSRRLRGPLARRLGWRRAGRVVTAPVTLVTPVGLPTPRRLSRRHRRRRCPTGAM